MATPPSNTQPAVDSASFAANRTARALNSSAFHENYAAFAVDSTAFHENYAKSAVNSSAYGENPPAFGVNSSTSRKKSSGPALCSNFAGLIHLAFGEIWTSFFRFPSFFFVFRSPSGWYWWVGGLSSASRQVGGWSSRRGHEAPSRWVGGWFGALPSRHQPSTTGSQNRHASSVSVTRKNGDA